MFNFLKICGYGLLAIVLSPIWVTLLAIMAVYGLVAFFVMTIRMIIIDIRNLFTKDKSKIKDPFGPLPEDYEVKRIKAAQEAVAVDIVSPVSSKPVEVVTAKEVTPDTLENDDSSDYPSLEDESPLPLEQQEETQEVKEEEFEEEAGEPDD